MDGQTNGSHHLNPYERPPESIRNVYKKFQKMYLNNLARDHEILDFENATTAQESGKVSVKEALDHDDPNNHFQMFAGNRTASLTADREVSMYECRELPGKLTDVDLFSLLVFPFSFCDIVVFRTISAVHDSWQYIAMPESL